MGELRIFLKWNVEVVEEGVSWKPSRSREIAGSDQKTTGL